MRDFFITIKKALASVRPVRGVVKSWISNPAKMRAWVRFQEAPGSHDLIPLECQKLSRNTSYKRDFFSEDSKIFIFRFTCLHI